MNQDYPNLPSVDLALGRAALRLSLEKCRSNDTGVLVMRCTIDRLLDRRLDLMRGAA